MNSKQLAQAKESLLNGLADGSIKTVKCTTYQDYLKMVYPNDYYPNMGGRNET